MNSDDTQKWRELFGVLLVTYGREPDEAQARFYFDALKDCELSDIELAARQHASTSKWFPKPAELRTLVIEKRFAALREVARLPVSREYHCASCSDSGWIYNGAGEASAVSMCPCRRTNPNYQRNLAHAQLHGEGANATHNIPSEEAGRLAESVRMKRIGDGN